MPKRSSKKRPRDLNELASSIVSDAVSDEATKAGDGGKNPHAVALGREGGRKGGPARAAKLSPERRSEIARLAAQTRYRKDEQDKED